MDADTRYCPIGIRYQRERDRVARGGVAARDAHRLGRTAFAEGSELLMCCKKKKGSSSSSSRERERERARARESERETDREREREREEGG